VKVTAMLAWYDEDPAILHRAVSSLGVIADHVIALDGRWNLYPGETQSSPPEQADAIRQGAADAGITGETFPAQQWTGQVQKRNRLLWLACNGSDWIMPLDADWELTGDRDAIRAELETTQADALIVPFHTPLNKDANLEDVAATGWHAGMAGQTVHEPLIWRTLEDMRVENFHWCVYGTKNGRRVSLWGNEGRCPQADTEPLKAPFRITHWCLHRDQRTIQANREYCYQRGQYVAANGIEP
jgi:hypothetical protein